LREFGACSFDQAEETGYIIRLGVEWSEWTCSRNTPNLQDTETISIRGVYKAPSPSITGSQLTQSFAMMLGMTRRTSGAVEVDVAASLSVLGSSRNTADNKAVGDPSIRYNP
jgi:hypothetical protein